MNESVNIIPIGGFGLAVARCLRRLRSDTVETAREGPEALTPERLPDARVDVLAAWRPVLGICEMLDEVSHRRGRAFIPLTVDSGTLHVGPVVVPGAGSCWHCWLRRTRQHTPGLQYRFALWQHYSRNDDTGPRGFLEPMAAIGAARVSQIIDAIDAREGIGGHVWQMDLMTRKITTSTVVGVHDCPRCGLHRPAEGRTYAEMQAALPHLWLDGKA